MAFEIAARHEDRRGGRAGGLAAAPGRRRRRDDGHRPLQLRLRLRVALPETATVYSNGAAVYSTLANTGVAAAPTASGTFPVYSAT